MEKGSSFTGFFTCFTVRSVFAHRSLRTPSLLAYWARADRFTLTTVSNTMKQQFGLIKRPWGVYYLKNKTTGEQTSLKTRDRVEAERLLQAHNETESQPHFNLALARVTAEDINWNTRTISYCRKKLKSRAGIKPALIRFGDEVAAILQRRPQAG